MVSTSRLIPSDVHGIPKRQYGHQNTISLIQLYNTFVIK